MQVASVFAWGVGGRRRNNTHRCDATPDAFNRGERLTDRQGKRALLPASIVPMHHKVAPPPPPPPAPPPGALQRGSCLVAFAARLNLRRFILGFE